MQLNILLIHADQHRADCLGCAGHPFLQTPGLDRLAAEGVLFERAYTPIPVCAPARNSLLFGCWPTRHQVIANPDTEAGRPESGALIPFSRVLQQAGYYLGYVGKWHVHPARTPLDYGFTTYIAEGQYTRWREAQGLPPVPRTAGWFGETDPGITPEQHRLAWGVDRAIELLHHAARTGTPFFIRFDPSEPHLPCTLPEPFASRYPPETIPPWPSFPDTLENKPFLQKQMRRTWGVEDWTWKQWQPVVARYLGMISLLDQQVGRLLAALSDTGLADNTLVIYTADHGDMCGAHGMIDKHGILYEDVARVPLLIRLPGGLQGTVSSAFVTHGLDLAATFCEAAGAALPDTFQGHSLMPLLMGEVDDQVSTRDVVFTQYMGSQFGLYSQRMAQDGQWKYIWNPTGGDELYHLAADPGELSNRAADPDCQDIAHRLRTRLVQWMDSIGDPLCNQWTRPYLTHAG